jgi:Rad3-related DNA helicase
MGDMSFDETHNVREAIDFLADKLTLREKLIQSAKQLSEKDQRFSFTVKRFEDLLADFLRLYQPVLDKIAGHKEALQREILSQRQALSGVTGMIEVAKGVDILAERVRELENEAKGIETTIKDKNKAIEKIDSLLTKAKHRSPDASRTEHEESIANVSEQADDFLLGLEESGRKPPASRRGAGR